MTMGAWQTLGRLVENGNRITARVEAHTKQLLAKHGFHIVGKLGYGNYGVAYELADGRVAKLTTDESEARTMYRLRTVDTKHLAQVDEVFRVPLGAPEMFVIIQEKLKKISEQEAEEFEIAMGHIVDAVGWRRYKAIATDWELLKDECLAAAEEFAATTAPGADDMPVEQANEWIRTVEDFQYPKAMAELRRLHIRAFDFHAGNLMKRGSDYVWIDLGGGTGGGHPGELPKREGGGPRLPYTRAPTRSPSSMAEYDD